MEQTEASCRWGVWKRGMTKEGSDTDARSTSRKEEKRCFRLSCKTVRKCQLVWGRSFAEWVIGLGGWMKFLWEGECAGKILRRVSVQGMWPQIDVIGKWIASSILVSCFSYKKNQLIFNRTVDFSVLSKVTIVLIVIHWMSFQFYSKKILMLTTT